MEKKTQHYFTEEDSKLEEDWKKRPEVQSFICETHIDGRGKLIPASYCLSDTQQST